MQTTLKTKLAMLIAFPIYALILITGLTIAISVIISIKVLMYLGVIDALVYLLKKTDEYAKKFNISYSMNQDDFMSKERK